MGVKRVADVFNGASVAGGNNLFAADLTPTRRSIWRIAVVFSVATVLNLKVTGTSDDTGDEVTKTFGFNRSTAGPTSITMAISTSTSARTATRRPTVCTGTMARSSPSSCRCRRIRG